VTQEDRLRGALYGKAIGDALGLPLEFMPRSAIRERVGNCPLEYRKVDRGETKWEAGDWSDDTEMALAILDAYLEDGHAKPVTVAQKFLDWATRDGRGMGTHTWNVLSDSVFLLDPFAVSEQAWENSGRNSAPNGGVMRAAAVGLLRPGDAEWTIRKAWDTCKVTHFDPRCVAGSVAVAVATALLVRGETIPFAIAHAGRAGNQFHGDCGQWTLASLKDLHLDEGLTPGRLNRRAPIGYTWKCMGAGFWALRRFHEHPLRGATTAEKFEEVLTRVIMAGGDTDTNAAVAGALLGAAAGLSLLPRRLVQGLCKPERLEQRIQGLLSR